MQPEHLDLHDSYGHHYVTLNLPAVEPPGECLPNSEIFRRLARALGLDHPRLRESDEETVRDVLDCDAARAAGITFERLRDEGCAARHRLRASRASPTAASRRPSGRLRLLAPELAERAPIRSSATCRRTSSRTRSSPSATRSRCSPPPRATCSTRRSPPCPGTAESSARRACTCIPRDAGERGIASGARVRVRNDRGAFIAEAVIDDAAQPGVAFTYKQQWPQLLGPGEHVNVTIPERDADLGGSPTFHDNRVRDRARSHVIAGSRVQPR